MNSQEYDSVKNKKLIFVIWDFCNAECVTVVGNEYRNWIYYYYDRLASRTGAPLVVLDC